MYAKLTAASGASIGGLLQELAKVCTGTISNAASLVSFDPVKSSIISTTATNWTLAYPTSFTANTNVYVLQSQCVDTGKYKYARLMVKGTGTNQPFVEPTGGTANVYTLTTSTTIYLEMGGATAVNTGTGAVTNPTYYHQSNEGPVLGSGSLYISASARHLFMYSDTATINTFLVAEYPETSITTSQTLTPMIAYRGRGSALTVTTTSRETAAAPGYSVAQIPAGYWVANTTSTLQSIDASTSFNTFEFTQTYTAARAPADRFPTRTAARQMMSRDLVYYDILRSHNFINASTLTGIRYIPDSAGITTVDTTTYTSANVTYAALPLTAYTSVLLVPKT